MAESRTAPDVNLPEGSLVEGEIRIVSYVTPEGEDLWGYSMSGDTSVTLLIGMLHRALHEISHRPEIIEDDDVGGDV